MQRGLNNAMRRITTFAIGLLLYAVALPVHAATITVTNTNDSGPGSLRQALADANDGDTINFDVSLKGQTIALTSDELVIDKSITITGPGSDQLAVGLHIPQYHFRVFHVMASPTVTIEGITIGPSLFFYGCGILNDQATLTINNCAVTGNNGQTLGAGISNGGTLTINNSSITGNVLEYQGSGVGISSSGTLIINNSIIRDNISGKGQTDGGGILNGGTLTISNSTVSANSALTINQEPGCGGGIGNNGSLQIANSTISGNSATNGGAICNDAASLEIANSILNAGDVGENIFNDGGTITSLGYNLSSDNGGGYLNGPGDQTNTDPILGPLQDNGGPTQTHRPYPQSPAIDAGDPSFTPPPFYDQRGTGFDRVVNGRIDIGSFEVQEGKPPPPSPTPTPTPSPTPTPTPRPTLTPRPRPTPGPRP